VPSRDEPPWLVGRRRNGGGRRDKAVGSWVNFFKLPTWHGFLPQGMRRRLPDDAHTVVAVDRDFLEASRAR